MTRVQITEILSQILYHFFLISMKVRNI